MNIEAPLNALQRGLLRAHEEGARAFLASPEKAAGIAQVLQIMLEAASASGVEWSDSRIHDIRPSALVLKRRR
jgi:hypothetical protein